MTGRKATLPVEDGVGTGCCWEMQGNAGGKSAETSTTSTVWWAHYPDVSHTKQSWSCDWVIKQPWKLHGDLTSPGSCPNATAVGGHPISTTCCKSQKLFNAPIPEVGGGVLQAASVWKQARHAEASCTVHHATAVSISASLWTLQDNNGTLAP